MAPDERIDIESLMAEIRQRAEEELLEGSTAQSRRQRLRFALENGRLVIERTLPPSPGLLGRWQAAARRFVFGEVAQTVQPALDKQSAWNRAVALLLQEQSAEIEHLRRQLEELSCRDYPDSLPSESAPEEPAPPSA